VASQLPARPSLEHLKEQAKELLRAYRAGATGAADKFKPLGAAPPRPADAKLADAQRAVALDYGFASWPKLKAHVESLAALADGDPEEKIRSAFRNDDADAVRAMLRRHPALRARINDPVFAFDSPAIMHVRSPAMLDALLEAGADVNARSRWWAGSFGLLDCAAPELAKYAVSRGAKIDAHSAARLGMADTLRGLLDADPSLVHARGGDGQTPLHFASTVDIAAILLDRGADIDALDVDHESTPAQWMVRDRQAVAKFLVSRGCRTDILMAAALGDLDRVRHHLDADPESVRTAVNEHYFPKINPRAGGKIYIWTIGANKTAHFAAKEHGHPEVLRLLMDRSPDDLKLQIAARLGDEPTFRALLVTKRLLRWLPEEEHRKLADAAQDNNTDAVRLMLEAGWPVDARGQHGGTALHWAAWHGNAAMLETILPYNPPLEDTGNDFHATPLGWAIHGSENGWYCKTGDYAKTVELLCAAGAKLPKDDAGTEAVKAVVRRFRT
jgi:ankyrin repeat protein